MLKLNLTHVYHTYLTWLYKPVQHTHNYYSHDYITHTTQSHETSADAHPPGQPDKAYGAL